MRFQQVKWNELTTKKYIIYNEYGTKFTGWFNFIHSNDIYFNHLKCQYQYIGVMIFSKNDYFYELVSIKNKIQNAMEQRALNIILRRLIGDEMFTWYKFYMV